MRRTIAGLGARVLALFLSACGSSAAIGPASDVARREAVAVPDAQAPAAAAAGADLERRAAALHRAAIVIDTHNDVTTPMLDRGFDLASPPDNAHPTHTDLARMKAGGLTAEFFAVYVDRQYADSPTAAGGGSARRALDMIDIVYRQVERHPEDLVLATRAEDIRRAKSDGKIAVLMGIEGGHAIENSLFALREFYRLGVRYMTLTHTNTNDWADSAGFAGPEPAKNHGLSSFGEEVVREMQRIGMLVDVSHVSDETFAAVIRVARAPVIASHSSARALADHRRNLTDDMLKDLAKNGGVAMANFSPGFIDQRCVTQQREYFGKHKDEIFALKKKYEATPGLFYEEMRKRLQCAPTPISVLIDHIDHMVKIAGVDHVGLGSDFDGVPSLPEGLDGIDKLPRITLELVKRGYSDDDVKKILGGNFLRVMEAAEGFARDTKTTLSGDGSTRRIDAPPSGK
jgi:membrane dipeptidase